MKLTPGEKRLWAAVYAAVWTRLDDLPNHPLSLRAAVVSKAATAAAAAVRDARYLKVANEDDRLMMREALDVDGD